MKKNITEEVESIGISQSQVIFAIQDLIEIVKELSKDKSIHEKLDKIMDDVNKNC